MIVSGAMTYLDLVTRTEIWKIPRNFNGLEGKAMLIRAFNKQNVEMCVGFNWRLVVSGGRQF
jgi:hypothetical protein